MNLFRNLLYSLVMFLYLTIQFYALMILTRWILVNIDIYQLPNSVFLTGLVLLLVGFLMIFLINAPFTFASIMLIRQITKLLPDRLYAVWFTRLFSILLCIIFIFRSYSVITGGKMTFIFIVVSLVMMRIAYINILLTNENLHVKKLSAEANMSEKELRAEMKLVIKETKAKRKIANRIQHKIDELNRTAYDDDGL